MQIPIQIDVHGRSVLGMFHLPEKHAPGSPVILSCAGLNGDRVDVHRMLLTAARKAEASGVSFVRFDYRGLGVSEGEYWQASVNSKIEDTLSVIQFIKGCFQNKKHSLILLSFSDGIRTAISTIDLIKSVQGLAMWNPILFPLSPELNYELSPKIIREPSTKELVCRYYGLWIGVEHLRQLTKDDSAQKYSHYEGPKFCAFAGNDVLVKETLQAISSEKLGPIHDTKIITVPGSNHLFGRYEWSKQVISATVEWAIEVGKKNVDK